MDEKFRRAEDEYFILRGKLEASRITRDEFEAALKAQMVTDSQGRYWTLGIDSGKWYMHDGKDWVRADPGAIPAPVEPIAPTANAPIPPTTPSRKSNRLPIVAAIGCLAIICLMAVAGIAYVVLNPGAPRPTLAASAPSAPLATPFLPVITTPTSEQINNAVPTSTSEPTATPVPPTDTPNPIPTATTAPSFPPGFYIIALQTNPPKPIRGQDTTFLVRFLNTTGSPRTYRWLVYIYRSDPSQQKNALGETPSYPFTFPNGTGVVEIFSWKVSKTGGCEDFVARPAWLDDNKRPTMFTKPDGQIFEQPFTICP